MRCWVQEPTGDLTKFRDDPAQTEGSFHTIWLQGHSANANGVFLLVLDANQTVLERVTRKLGGGPDSQRLKDTALVKLDGSGRDLQDG